MSHIESLPTAEHRAGMRVLLGTLRSLLARQTPEQLEEIWKDCFPSELALQQDQCHVTAAAFMAALTAAVEGPHAAAAEEPQTSSAECEDV